MAAAAIVFLVKASTQRSRPRGARAPGTARERTLNHGTLRFPSPVVSVRTADVQLNRHRSPHAPPQKTSVGRFRACSAPTIG